MWVNWLVSSLFVIPVATAIALFAWRAGYRYGRTEAQTEAQMQRAVAEAWANLPGKKLEQDLAAALRGDIDELEFLRDDYGPDQIRQDIATLHREAPN